ncbi:hypothetical protein [Microbispora sp. NPDC046933]|uniref:hypothetical protein n=1 Tax=Microbispora sp. NPDC046933 TaxID=3155618 RepID=UPI0033F393AB
MTMPRNSNFEKIFISAVLSALGSGETSTFLPSGTAVRFAVCDQVWNNRNDFVAVLYSALGHARGAQARQGEARGCKRIPPDRPRCGDRGFDYFDGETAVQVKSYIAPRGLETSEPLRCAAEEKELFLHLLSAVSTYQCGTEKAENSDSIHLEALESSATSAKRHKSWKKLPDWLVDLLIQLASRHLSISGLFRVGEKVRLLQRATVVIPGSGYDFDTAFPALSFGQLAVRYAHDVDPELRIPQA